MIKANQAYIYSCKKRVSTGILKQGAVHIVPVRDNHEFRDQMGLRVDRRSTQV